MARLFLHFWNVSASFRIWQKEPVSQICIVPFSNLQARAADNRINTVLEYLEEQAKDTGSAQPSSVVISCIGP